MEYYHGTDKDFNNFDLSKAMTFKDFGVGFYLSQKQWHAESVALKKRGEHAYIRVYDIDFEEMKQQLDVKQFKKASLNWVKFVILNRTKIIKPQYDIVIGATADAAAQEIIEKFCRKHKKAEPTIKEYRQLISELAVYNYPVQMVALNQKAVDYIEQHLVNIINIK